MCLLFLAYEYHPGYSWILAANRDEFYDRPTAPLHWWTDPPWILAGRDLKNRGTWLGLDANGRMAAITNYREPGGQQPDRRSRGWLVSDFLGSDQSPAAYLHAVEARADAYNGFNLMAGDPQGFCCYSNRKPGVERLGPGLHGLSNRFLNTPWPKVTRGKALLERVLKRSRIAVEAIFEVLADTHQPPTEALPDTGVPLKWEQLLSPIFVRSPVYGTRSSSVILAKRSGTIRFFERSFIPTPSGMETRDREFSAFLGSV